MEKRKPAFNQRYYDQLIREGMSHAEACLIASTEMAGAHTNELGHVDANQTNCDVLEYDEDGPAPSREMIQAQKKGRNAAEQAAIDAGFPSLKAYYKSLGLSTRDIDD